MLNQRITLSISHALFTAVFLIFFFTLLNGYLLNLLGDYRANAWLVLFGVVIEMSATVAFARRVVKVERDPFELAGFLFVVSGVWIYFVAASLPTFLPPTFSNDAVRVYLQALFSFPDGKLVSWYPAGGAFIVAMFARWFGGDPLRVLHPVAASFLALSAGAVYGMTCAILREQRAAKIFALGAAGALFIPWTYFAGIVDGEQYFFAQAVAQYFILAAWWFAARYADKPNWTFAALFGAALLGIVAAYPYFVPLALALFGFTYLLSLLGKNRAQMDRATVRALIIFLALVALTVVALQRGGILEILAAGRIATSSGVGEGGVTNPSLENLGGVFFLLSALAGIPFAWRAGARGRAVIALLFAWGLQLIGLLALQPILNISEYRVDKTFYLLVFPCAMLCAIFAARVWENIRARLNLAPRARTMAGIALVALLSASVIAFRPPKYFTPLSESEIQTARWAKENLDTFQIAYLDPLPIRAYWLAFGMWRETIPNEWFQWIPAGRKMGPATFDEWLNDPAWHPYVLVSDVNAVRADAARIVYQNGASAILQKNILPRAEPAPQFRLPWYVGSTFKLFGYDLARSTFAPGAQINFATYTETIFPPPATVGWRAELVDRDGNVMSQTDAEPFANKYPLQRWPPGIIARDEWTLNLARDLAPGAYELRLGLYRRENGEPIGVWHASEADAVHKKFLNAAPIARLKIPLAPPRPEELQRAQILNARLGENFSLARYALEYDRAARKVRLTLYWQGIAKNENDYTVFVHLLDAAGKIIAQKDAEPRAGAYPTSLWDAGEIIPDAYEFDLGSDAAPTQIEIGMYLPRDLKRVPVFDARGAAIGDVIMIRIGD
ncbi:MAG: hypothetical protein HY070_10710 [Chloroflexi bacterium]|nr:hypothetical protein [Chloroflexota bacterium]